MAPMIANFTNTSKVHTYIPCTATKGTYLQEQVLTSKSNTT